MKKQWKTTTLASCVQLSSGGTPSMNKSDYWGGDIPWVSSKDMKSLRLYDTEDHITEIAVEHGAKLVPTGTILVAVRGMRLAKSLPIVEVQQPVSFNQDLKAIKCKENILSRFLLYWLISQEHELLGRCDEAAHGTKRLQTDRLLSMSIELPSLSTQLLIADILTAYDDLIDNNTRRIALLEESIHRLYQEWFVYLRFPGCDRVKVVDGVPEGWKRGCVGDIAKVRSGFAFKSKDWIRDGNPVIRIKNLVGDGSINIANCECIDDTVAKSAETFLLHPGELLIAMTGATVGKVGLMPNVERNYYLNQRVGRFASVIEEQTEYFLYSFFVKESGQTQVQNLALGAAQPNISSKQIESIELLIPAKSISKIYTDSVSSFFRLRQNLMEQNEKLREARDLLLPRLMNGSLAV